jgi:hypothetical protein
MEEVTLNGVTVGYEQLGGGFYRNVAPGHCSVAAPATKAVRSLQNGKAEAMQQQSPRDNHATDHFGFQHP